MRKLVVYSWNFIFNANVSPLRNIKDVAMRHYVLQALGLMWAIAFATATGSYFALFASVLGHAVLIAAAAITVITYAVASKAPDTFSKGMGRRKDSEHI